MKIIWTKSKLPLSLLIRWGLKEPVSHVAVVFDEKIVFHSNLSGTHVEWFNSFKKRCEIVYELNIPLSLEEEEKVYLSAIDTYDGRAYDYMAFAYFIWRAMLWRFLGKPLPLKNKWQTNRAYICTGLVGKLPDNVISSLSIKDTEMVSPYQMYLMLNKMIDRT